MKYITTREAAEICGVSTVTIQKLVREGYFNYKMSGKMYRIALEDVEKYSDKIGEIHKAEKSIDDYLVEVQGTIESINKERKDAEDALSAIGLYPSRVRAIKNVLYRFMSIYGERFTDSEQYILDHYLEGRFFSDIANESGKTRQNAHRLYNKAMRKLCEITRYEDELEMKIKDLEEENKKLRRQVISLESKEEEVHLEEHKEKLMNVKLVDCPLSVRLLNICKCNDINTITDLALIPNSEVLKIRNFGRKCYGEAVELLEKHGLGFGMTHKEIAEKIK